MSKFHNLKIPVENNLYEIVMELDARGYTQWDDASTPKFIITHKSGMYQMVWNDTPRLKDWKLTTLSELKNTNDILKGQNPHLAGFILV